MKRYKPRVTVPIVRLTVTFQRHHRNYCNETKITSCTSDLGSDHQFVPPLYRSCKGAPPLILLIVTSLEICIPARTS